MAKKTTSTSSFGSSKREGHDASAFYKRDIYGDLFVPQPSKKELLIEIPSAEGWSNALHQATSERLEGIPDNGVSLAFTSPPYNVGKDYDDDISLVEYLELIQRVGAEVYRVLRPGGRYVVNIANLGRKPYIPMHAFFYNIHMQVGFLPMGEIIWQKAKGASGNCAWGSWLSATAPRLRDIHEYLLVFTKQAFARPLKGVSDIGKDEFLEATLSVWQIPPARAKKIGHPAPFPVELASRVIRLYSFKDEVVLDPFMGSGSTCVAAIKTGRRYLGYDISAEYYRLAQARVAEALSHVDDETLKTKAGA